MTLGLVLGLFAAVYPLLHAAGFEVHGTARRLATSWEFFPVGVALVVAYPRVGVPFAIGVVPILLVLRAVGAVYGLGVDLFYLVVSLAAWYRLPPDDSGRPVRIRGRSFLLLFLGQCVFQSATEAPRLGTDSLVLPVQMAGFYVVLYLMSRRVTIETFELALKALATGCFTMLVWTLATANPAGLLTGRVGAVLGLNPNLTAQFAILLVYCVLLLFALRPERSLGALTFLTIAFAAVFVFLTASRLALLQLVLAGFLPWPKFRLIRSAATWAPVALVVVLATGAASVVSAAASIVESPQYTRLQQFQLEDRKDLSALAWQLAAENPAFGVGPGNFVLFSLDRGLREAGGEGSYHHDAIAGTAAEFGFVGLGLFLLWFVSILGSRGPGRSYSPFVVVLGIASMVGGVTHGLFLDFVGSLLFLFAVLSERFVSSGDRRI